MPDAVTTLPRRGQTYLSGSGRTIAATDAAHLEGTMKLFDDIAPGQTSGAVVRRSGRQTLCMLVRNSSGIALEAKRLVKWESGERGKSVDGYCAISVEECAGVVDEHIGSAGAPINDLFWIAVRGPSLMRTSLTANAECLTPLESSLVALTAVTSQSTTSGRIVSQAATTNVTFATSFAMQYVAKALSALTTANTNSDILADLNILKTA